MSILQEYRAIRRRLGERKYRNIEKFLETHPNYYLSDVYYNEDAWNHFLLWEIKNEKDKNSWLTRDEELRQRYTEDKFCSYRFTARGFYDLFDLLESVSKKDWATSLPRQLPVLLMSGDRDPVGRYGRGVDKVYKRMVKAGMNDVTVRLYNGARHSLFDETCRKAIIDHTVDWIEMNM